MQNKSEIQILSVDVYGTRITVCVPPTKGRLVAREPACCVVCVPLVVCVPSSLRACEALRSSSEGYVMRATRATDGTGQGGTYL